MNSFRLACPDLASPLRKSSPAIEPLETRIAPAAGILIIEGASGAGDLDDALLAGGDVLAAEVAAATTGTISTGALESIAGGTNISVTSPGGITFDGGLTSAVSLQTAGGASAAFVALGGDITFADTNDSLTTASGALTLSASGDLAPGSLTTTGGNITLVADTMAIGVGTSISAGGALVSLAPATAGRAIDLGGADVPGSALGLTDAELDRVTASAITVGTTGSGDVSVSGTITTLNTLQLEVVTGGAILDTGGQIIETRLGLSAGTGIGTPGTPLDIICANVEMAATSGGIFVSFTANPFTIGGVSAGLNGVTAGGGDIVITSNRSITASEGFANSGGGNISVATSNGDLTISGPVATTGGNGTVVLTAAGNLSINAAISTAGTGAITTTSGAGAVSLGGGSTLAIEIAGANHDALSATGTVTLGGALQLTSSGAFTLGQSSVILANDGVDPIVGTFTGLPEGSVILSGTALYGITYAGGDGNDVALTALSRLQVAANGQSLTYTDGNGDLVAVKVTRGTLDATNALFAAGPHGGVELLRLDLSAAEFAGSDVTITATKTATRGDGRAHLGYLNAGANDLGRVTIPGDLARIDVGDGNATKPAVAALTVGSMGVVDLSQNLGLGLWNNFAGDIGALTIRGDYDGRQIFVAGNIGPVNIGSSMIGGADTYSGEIYASGSIQSATIGGSIIGGDGASSARLFATGNLGPVKVGGMVRGGIGDNSGQIVSNGSVASVTIGKSLIGGTGGASGQIYVVGVLGPVKIGGAVFGGDGASSGQIIAGGNIASASIAGSIVGGDGAQSGGIQAFGATLGPVKIGGGVLGGDGSGSGQIMGVGNIAPVSIAGSIVGGDGNDSGAVISFGHVASVAVTGSLVGGVGERSGRVFADDNFGPINVGGSVQGGDGDFSGQILSMTGNAAAVKIGGSLVGGGGLSSGTVEINGALASLTLGGSVLGGDGDYSGWVRAGGNLGATIVKGDLVGGEGTASAALRSNTASAGVSGPVTIGGDIIGSTDSSALVWSELGSWKSVTVGGSLIGGDQEYSGGIFAGRNLGAVLIKGSVLGDAAQDVFIRAGGSLAVATGATSNVALSSLTVRGSVEHAQVLVGYGGSNTPVNGGVQMGAVNVRGDWSQSSILVGHDDGADDLIGTADDTRIVGGPAGIVARIASITIGGAISGTLGGSDHFGFVATQIGAFKAAGLTAPMTAGTDAVEVGFFTGDVTVREIA